MSKFQKDRTVTLFLLPPILIRRDKIQKFAGQNMYFLFRHTSPLSMCHFSLTFLHSVFSSVSSNYLPEKRHSHIACICLTFLHCVFSYDPSKTLHKRKQSYIGCICLAFLHCAFSNESSNYLHKKMHWLHLFDFSPLCIFKCIFKFPAWEEE